MPRFFFDTADGRTFHDTEGTSLEDFRAAQREAVQILCQLLPGHDIESLADDGFEIRISDEKRRLLMTLNLSLRLAGAPDAGVP